MPKINEKEFDFTTENPNEVVGLDHPGRVNLKKLNVVRIGGGPITVDMFNREFTGEPVEGTFRLLNPEEVQRYVNVNRTSGLVVFEADSPVLARIADVLVTTAPGTPYDGQNTRIRFVGDFKSVILLDLPEAAIPPARGTVQLNIPAEEQSLSQVMPQQTGTNDLIYFPEFDGGTLSYHNRDVINPRYDIGTIRKVYLRLANPGEYKVSIGAQETI